jgi:hypothetical protein
MTILRGVEEGGSLREFPRLGIEIWGTRFDVVLWGDAEAYPRAEALSI